MWYMYIIIDRTSRWSYGNVPLHNNIIRWQCLRCPLIAFFFFAQHSMYVNKWWQIKIFVTLTILWPRDSILWLQNNNKSVDTLPCQTCRHTSSSVQLLCKHKWNTECILQSCLHCLGLGALQRKCNAKSPSLLWKWVGGSIFLGFFKR